MHVCACVRVCVFLSVSVRVHVCARACVHMYVCVYVLVGVHVPVLCVRVCACARTLCLLLYKQQLPDYTLLFLCL